MKDKWLNEGFASKIVNSETATSNNKLCLNELKPVVLNYMTEMMEFGLSEVINILINNTLSSAMASYCLLMKKLLRHQKGQKRAERENDIEKHSINPDKHLNKESEILISQKAEMDTLENLRNYDNKAFPSVLTLSVPDATQEDEIAITLENQGRTQSKLTALRTQNSPQEDLSASRASSGVSQRSQPQIQTRLLEKHIPGPTHRCQVHPMIIATDFGEPRGRRLKEPCARTLLNVNITQAAVITTSPAQPHYCDWILIQNAYFPTEATCPKSTVPCALQASLLDNPWVTAQDEEPEQLNIHLRPESHADPQTKHHFLLESKKGSEYTSGECIKKKAPKSSEQSKNTQAMRSTLRDTKQYQAKADHWTAARNRSFQENMKNSPMIRCSVSPVTAALDLRGAEIPAEVFPAGGHLMALVKVLDSGYEAGRKRRESGHGGTATAAILKKLRCPGEPQGFRHRLRTGLALSPYEPSNLVA
ncbi:Hormonally up-regulated neu tumor-associated kinase [Anas platyrhynchos]|uniref:Hormonally up-regulated neu tumor-associated kinase n=1 Tax=Anas platyrhynchos TaxID=8839 RepID=R0K7D9_ANAPL|nr:Hormonally up-regulated neu tumor-associated kinase [Anas platyrhynchos]